MYIHTYTYIYTAALLVHLHWEASTYHSPPDPPAREKEMKARRRFVPAARTDTRKQGHSPPYSGPPMSPSI